MKRISQFLKATTVGGLFILLPVIIVGVVIVRIVGSVRDAAETIMVKFLGGAEIAEEFPLLVSIVFLLLVSFLLGIGMTSGKGRKAGSWFERTILSRIPGYSALKAVLGGFTDGEEESSVRVGLLTLDEGMKCVVFVMERHGDGWLTVFTPETPNPTSGTVSFVREDRVQILPLRIHEIGPTLQHWGVGMKGVLAKAGGLSRLTGVGEATGVESGDEELNRR